jgi:uncharacterized damage-inducible protein DinB
MNYGLHLESGPQRKQTLMHVFELLGCVHRGPTSDATIEAAPAVIRGFLAFLARHGADIDPAADFTVHVASHDTSGGFIGSSYFGYDREPIGAEECERYVQRLAWMREDTLALVAGLSAAQLAAEPAKGRPIGRILSHILGADYGYLGSGRLRVPGLHALSSQVDKGEREPREALREATPMVLDRLRAMTEEDRERIVERPTGVSTARRMFRSFLEHNWEHYQEILVRLESQ